MTNGCVFEVGRWYEAPEKWFYSVKVIKRTRTLITVNNGRETWRMRVRYDQMGNEIAWVWEAPAMRYEACRPCELMEV